MRKLGKVTETVAAYRLREMGHLQTVEKLATWRRAHGYDRIADDDDHWASRPLLLTPEEFTASLWEELNALQDAISMSGRHKSRQKAKSFIDELKQGTTSLTDEKFAMINRLVESRERNAAQATVAPADTAQYRSPSSTTPEISSDVRVCIEKNEEGMVNPEPTELESPSAGTGLETPGQQCPQNGEAGRTTADGCLLVGVGSNLGGNTSSLTERVGTRAGTATTPVRSLKTASLKASRKPEDKEKGSEENNQFDPGGNGEKPLPWNAAVMVLLSFSGGNIGPWVARCLYLVFFSGCTCLFVLFLIIR